MKSTDETQNSIKDRIDKEVKRLAGDVRKSSPIANRANAALGFSLLALATQQAEPSKAKVLLDLMKDLDL